MRAGLYVRISKDRTGEHLGVQRQEEDCRKLVAELGWEVAEVYVDNDVSATSGRARPGYKRLIADIEAGLITGVVVWSPDRLYRRAADLEQLIPVIEAHNVQVRTVKAGDLDLATAYGRMIARILGAIATGEGDVKSERWKRSWQQRREAGRPVTTGPHRLFGYARDGVTLNEPEAAAAQRMADDLLGGGTVTGVVRWLEEEAISTTAGGAWSRQGVKHYLRNPRIAGFSTMAGEIVGPGEWPAILDPETWEEVRAILNSRTRAAVPRRSLLLGLLHCGRCGGRMVASGAGKKPGGGSRRAYRCEAKGCGVLGVAEPVEEIVEGYVEERLQDPAVRRRIEALGTQPGGAQNELAALEGRIKELELTLDEPGTPVPTIMRAIGRAKDRQGELLDKLAAQPRVAIPEAGLPWPADLARRRALVDLVVARVELLPSARPTNRFNPDRVKITER